MKRFILIAVLFITLLTFTGCYTVIWTPDQEFPTEVRSSSSYEYYYDDYYYGDYSYYYAYPWWYNITPPAVVETQPDRNSAESGLRNEDGSRQTSGRTNSPSGEVIRTGVTTTSTNSGTGSTKDSSGKDTSATKGTTKSSSDDSRPGRNNDGGRDTDGGRRR